MKTFDFGKQSVDLRKSYEVDNCVCVKFTVGFIRIDYNGLQKDELDVPRDFAKVIGVDFCEV